MSSSKFVASPELVAEVQSMHADARTKNEVANYIISVTNDFSSVDKTIRQAGISFKRVANNWDACVAYFDETDEPEKDGLTEYLQENTDMDEVKAKKYTSSYFYVLNEVYKLIPTEV